MSSEPTTELNNEVEATAVVETPKSTGEVDKSATPSSYAGKKPFVKKEGFGKGARGGKSFEKPQDEFAQKIISIRRVTRVVSGGRRMSFSVAMLLGDKKGSIGLGTGKAIDTALAINKAIRDAKKNMVKIKVTKNMSIPHQVEAKYSSSVVVMMPNNGRGLVSGSSIRDLLNLAGIKDVNTKLMSRSKNKINNAKAALKALANL